jgi:hypothetical protein
MLTLVFGESAPAPSIQLGPFDEVRCDGEHMRAGGRPIAEHRDHCWFVEGRRFFRIDCKGPVRAHFEDGAERSATIGPFVHFSCADGIAYADGEICGHVDLDTKLWYSPRDGREWREMVVVPAS